jgi:hypothetical protein
MKHLQASWTRRSASLRGESSAIVFTLAALLPIVMTPGTTDVASADCVTMCLDSSRRLTVCRLLEEKTQRVCKVCHAATVWLRTPCARSLSQAASWQGWC